MAGDLNHLFYLALLFSLARETASKIRQHNHTAASVRRWYVVPAIEQLKRASGPLQSVWIIGKDISSAQRNHSHINAATAE